MTEFVSFSICRIPSGRSFSITMFSRSMPDAPPELVLTQAEIGLLCRFVKDNKRSNQALPKSRYLMKIAQLGGYFFPPKTTHLRQHRI